MLLNIKLFDLTIIRIHINHEVPLTTKYSILKDAKFVGNKITYFPIFYKFHFFVIPFATKVHEVENICSYCL